jgi:hypothetical protein
MRYDLCQVLHQRKQLVVIFEFVSERHHGNLEDAILEALFNGGYCLLGLFKNMYLLFL